MNLHEFQAKQLFRDYGIATPDGHTATNASEVRAACKALGGSRWVVKAQVHAGGRGKAGGVELVESVEDATSYAEKILGTRLVTYQTDAGGQPVDTLLVENVTDIANELYLGAVLDRSKRAITIIASREGGVEIEKVADETPEKIHTATLHPLGEALPYQGRALAFKLGLEGAQVAQFAKIFCALANLFVEKDLSLIEINPLVITGAGDLLCLDGKINVDSNAEFRQTVLWQLRDTAQEDEREIIATEHGFNYVALDGNIGCLVNGAGLAMATMDIIKLHEGAPANFLDIGGTADAARVTNAFKLILSDPSVKAILVNIFGGIVRCDLIAEGIIEAAKSIELTARLVVRLQGNQSDVAKKLLDESGLPIDTADDLSEAAKKAVAAAQA